MSTVESIQVEIGAEQAATLLPAVPCEPHKCGGRSWLRLVGPLLVLAVEIGVLTPFVEFADGPMGYVANARVCAGLLLALVAFVLLTGGQLRVLELSPATGRPCWPLWLVSHLGLYGVFFLLTIRLAEAAPDVSQWVAGALWVLLGLGVGVTAVLTFVPLLVLRQWGSRNRGSGSVALGLGLAFALLIPWFQSWWPEFHGPAVAIDKALLQWTYGDARVGTTRQGEPILGARRFLVRVTPQCSELESLAALWMLGGVVVLSRWGEWRKVRVALALVVCTAVLYLLIAVRLYGLVVAGITFSPKVCVDLAHSRIGGILFLGVTACLLLGLGRWCGRARVRDV